MITASKLRENVYRILDQVLATGVPVEVVRKGRRLRIVAVDPPVSGLLDRLEPHPGTVIGDPEELVHTDWSSEWRADLP